MKDGTTQGSWEGRWKERHLIVMTFGLLEPLDSTVFVVTSALELFSYMWQFSSVQSSCSVVFDSLWPHQLQHARLPCHYQLPEPTQTHVHRVSDAIQPFHPLSSPSPPAFNLSHHQGLFHWVSSSHEVVKALEFLASASVLPMNIQDWFPSGLTGLISLQSKRLPRVFSNTKVKKHQNKSFLYGPTLTSIHDYWKNHSFD